MQLCLQVCLCVCRGGVFELHRYRCCSESRSDLTDAVQVLIGVFDIFQLCGYVFYIISHLWEVYVLNYNQ